MNSSLNGTLAGKRVGLIVPSTNTVMEPDLYRNLPSGTTVHTSRMLLEGSVTIEAEELMLDVYLPECARQIGTLQPDVVVFGCTSAGALRGPAYEQELAGEISQATGAPTVTIMGAVVDELKRLGVNSVALLTPYSEEINDTIKDSLETSGFTVPYMNGMDVKGSLQHCRRLARGDFGLRGGRNWKGWTRTASSSPAPI